jgi:hypothetical protein
MTICRPLPADFCLRRAVLAQVSGDRQTSPVLVSSGRPAHSCKRLIARMVAALRSGRLRFLPCFSGETRGETGTLVPLFAPSVRVISSTRQTKLACVERGVSLPFRCRERNRCEKPAFPSLLASSGGPFASLLLSLSRTRHQTVSAVSKDLIGDGAVPTKFSSLS